MSLTVLFQSAINEHLSECIADDADGVVDDHDLAEHLSRTVVTALSETPLRVEVFEGSQSPVLEDISITTVHEVLDSLINILKGVNV